jgi:hypothetical protein
MSRAIPSHIYLSRRDHQRKGIRDLVFFTHYSPRYRTRSEPAYISVRPDFSTLLQIKKVHFVNLRDREVQ